MKKIINTTAVFILVISGVLMLGSMWNDSPIFDETAHIPAGYANLVLQDYRLNPEHPPLVKMVSAIPLAFKNLNFPTHIAAWTEQLNGQWDMGHAFFFEAGNDPESLVFWARIPMILLSLLTGWILFLWVRKEFGNGTALLTLTLYAFSPTIIAHSRFVTTDIGATLGFLIGCITFTNFLRNPSWKNTALAGIAFGLAQLLKFSAALLLPMYMLIFIVWIGATYFAKQKLPGGFLRFLGKFISIFIFGALTIWPVYQYAVWNYPPALEKHEMREVLESHAGGSTPLSVACGSLSRLQRCPAELAIWASDKPILRAYSQYVFGVLMSAQRSAGGNTTYYLGNVSAKGSASYFPISFITKETLSFMILLVIAAYLSLKNIWLSEKWSLQKIAQWVYTHAIQFSALVIIGLYWYVSARSALNIGVRHVLPTFPFIYLLSSIKITEWLTPRLKFSFLNIFESIRGIWKKTALLLVRYSIFMFIIICLIGGVVLTFPNYLSYYNILGGGVDNGYLIATDSNYDWGQDLYRLRDYMDEHHIDKISLHYFGGGSPEYSLSNRFEPWWSARGPAHGWFAISSTILMGSQGNYIEGLTVKTEDSYSWLTAKPVGRAGKSIFIYNLP